MGPGRPRGSALGQEVVRAHLVEELPELLHLVLFVVLQLDPGLVHDLLGPEDRRAETDGEGDPLIRSSGNGSSFSIFFYGCTDNAACKALRFTAGYDLANGAKLETVEAWDRERRFASAYLDDEDDPFLQMDVNTDGGITQTNFEKTFELWQRLKVEFEEHIGF